MSSPIRDQPLSFHWSIIQNEFLDIIGLPEPLSASFGRARTSILTELVVQAETDPKKAISYSRRKQFYVNGARYRGTDYSYNNVIRAIDEFDQYGLIEHFRMPPGNLGWQSSFLPSEKFIELIKQRDLPQLRHHPYELIRLKDQNGTLVDYRDTEQTHRMRQRTIAINDIISSSEIHLPDAQPYSAYAIRIGEQVLHPMRTSLYRVFNRSSWSMGGRLYGAFWQQLPKKVRGRLQLDGRPVTELDFPTLHPRLLYAQTGHSLDGDAYDITGWSRPLVKTAFNILVNANTRQKAVAAIAQQIGGAGAFKTAADLVSDICERHPAIHKAFGSGAGLRLQRIDADMAERVLLNLQKQGIVALPIHDSFIVEQHHQGELQSAMDEAFEVAKSVSYF
jgi:hypothetical protein